MKLRELAQVILTGREAARRVGCTFQLNHFRVNTMGVSSEDIEKVMKTVRDIEHFQETALSSLAPTNGRAP